MEIADKTANRLFEAAKETFLSIYKAFGLRVEAYKAQMEGIKAHVGINEVIINTQLGIDNNKTQIYVAELQGYKTELDAIIAVIDGEARLYAAKVTGYKAEIDRAEAILNARVERLKALIAQSTDLTQLQVKEAEVNLQAYINSLGLNIETSKAIASILGQVAASSLGALNTHTSMSDGTSRSFGSSYSHSQGVANTKTHTFSEGTAEE